MKIRHLITALLTIVLALNVTAGPASASWWEDVTEGWERLWDDDNDLGTGVNGGEEDPGIGDDDDSAGGDEGGFGLNGADLLNQPGGHTGSPKRVQRPPGPRKVGMPLSAERPAPTSAPAIRAVSWVVRERPMALTRRLPGMVSPMSA